MGSGSALKDDDSRRDHGRLDGTYGRRRGAPGLLLATFVLFAACGADPSPAAVPADADAGTAPDTGTNDASAPTPPDAATPDERDSIVQSGTRLRRQYLEGGPGAVRTLDLYDKELETSCSFRTAPDEALRCLPLNLLGSPTVYFADASCSAEPIMLPDTTGCRYDFGKTAFRPTIYRRTATQVPGDGTAYLPNPDGTCVARSVGGIMWVAEAVPSTTFVQGTTRDEPRSGGMVARYVDGADGSHILLSARDAARATDCDLTSEPGRCVPRSRASVELFADAACSAPVARHDDTTSSPDILVEVRRLANGCTASSDYYEVGAKLAADAPLYRRAGASCISASSDPSSSYYARGASVPVSAFPAVTVRQDGAGKIQARRHVDADGKALGLEHAFWEPEHDRECFAGDFDDGAYRCAPTNSGLYYKGYFSDAACSTSPVGIYSCEPAPGPYILRSVFGQATCIPDVYSYDGIYERGPAVTGPIYYAGSSPPCAQATAAATASVHDVGAAVLPSTFPALELKTE